MHAKLLDIKRRYSSNHSNAQRLGCMYLLELTVT